jgi:hypothetical protein
MRVGIALLLGAVLIASLSGFGCRTEPSINLLPSAVGGGEEICQGWVWTTRANLSYRIYGPDGQLWWDCPVSASETFDRGFKVKATCYDDVRDQVINTYRKGHPGVRDGLVRAWYPSGVLKHVQPFEDDRQHGTSKTYYPSGRMENVRVHEHGQLKFEGHLYPTGEWQGTSHKGVTLPPELAEELARQGYDLPTGLGL